MFFVNIFLFAITTCFFCVRFFQSCSHTYNNMYTRYISFGHSAKRKEHAEGGGKGVSVAGFLSFIWYTHNMRVIYVANKTSERKHDEEGSRKEPG